MTINRFYLFLTFLVIVISGNPVMNVLIGKETVYIGTLMIFLVWWVFRPLKFTRQDILILVLFILLVLTHVLTFGLMVVAASLGFLIKVGIALLAIRLIPEFPRQYVSVMYFLACLSLVFYIPVQMGIDLAGILSPIRIPLPNAELIHIGIHNFHLPDQRGRNSGMFWEPGAFAGYLILALFFLVRDGKSVLKRRGLMLIVALLTTQSTTGYLAFMILTVFYAYKADWVRGKAARLVVFPLILVVLTLGAWLAFSQVSFLGEKINQQLESAVLRDDSSRMNRLGNLLYDLKWIAEKPVLGWSANPETRFPSDPDIAELSIGQGNGLTGSAIRFGLFGIFIYFGFFAYSTQRIAGSLSSSLLGIVIVCVLLNGEQFMNFPIFLSLMFVPQNKLKSLPISPMAARKLSFSGGRTGH